MRPGPLAAACALLAAALVAVAWRPWVSGGPDVSPIEPGAPAVVDPASGSTALPLAGRARPDAAAEVLPGRTSSSSTAPSAAIEAGREDLLTPGARAADGSARIDFRIVQRGAARLDAPVPGVRLWFLREGEAADEARVLGATDQDGRLARSLPSPGGYQFWMDTSDLPAGFTSSHVTAELEHVTRFFRADFVTELELALVETRSLSGVVLDDSGGPATGVQVRLLAVTIDPLNPRRSREMGSDFADDSGRFEWSRLPSGEYVVSVRSYRQIQIRSGFQTSGSFLSHRKRLTYPPGEITTQVYVDLRERSAEQVELTLGDLDLPVRGRVVDAEGQPVEGAEVTAIETRVLGGPWNAATPFAFLERVGWSDKRTTTAEGTFEFLPVPRNVLRFEVRLPAAKQVRTAVFGAASLEPARVEFDLTSISQEGADLGDIMVETIRPFELRGRVELGNAPTGEERALLFDARFPRGSFPRVDVEGQERPYSSFDPETGAFVVRCNTPRDVVEIALFWRSRPQDEKVFTFRPAPNETREDVVLEFP